ncbi:cytosolic 10-formyltetrahydrofolate dehydrogenase [Anopheles sinensis]|uniref:Cytosolic 10-formyltetrahydrofolate dehydrogenase n=1 Tax=Anopheles sinensis TaxID=74873 RepID=A0A084W3C4_ANOSI|nr:cytosolic 10-formyltetrahydrofolate dehydrogenase [Anopheles sinensis]
MVARCVRSRKSTAASLLPRSLLTVRRPHIGADRGGLTSGGPQRAGVDRFRVTFGHGSLRRSTGGPRRPRRAAAFDPPAAHTLPTCWCCHSTTTTTTTSIHTCV